MVQFSCGGKAEEKMGEKSPVLLPKGPSAETILLWPGQVGGGK
jgi:hypothetical protein